MSTKRSDRKQYERFLPQPDWGGTKGVLMKALRRTHKMVRTAQWQFDRPQATLYWLDGPVSYADVFERSSETLREAARQYERLADLIDRIGALDRNNGALTSFSEYQAIVLGQEDDDGS